MDGISEIKAKGVPEPFCFTCERWENMVCYKKR